MMSIFPSPSKSAQLAGPGGHEMIAGSMMVIRSSAYTAVALSARGTYPSFRFGQSRKTMSGVPSPSMSAMHSGVVPARAGTAAPALIVPAPLPPTLMVLVVPVAESSLISVGGGTLVAPARPPGTTWAGGAPAHDGSGLGGLLHRPVDGLQVPARWHWSDAA